MKAGKGFDYFQDRLGTCAWVLRFMGVFLAAGTAAAASLFPVMLGEKITASSASWVAWIVLIGFNISLVLAFEMVKKNGEAIFEELSDEFQWNLRSGKRGNLSPSALRPPLELRVELRSFLSASNLPLAPERSGPLIYMLLNLLVFLVGAGLRLAQG